jgi:hypothetical protein
VRVFQRLIKGFKSMPAIAVRTMVGALLGTGDMASDVVTIVTLFGLGHLDSAYALLTMVLPEHHRAGGGPESPVFFSHGCMVSWFRRC